MSVRNGLLAVLTLGPAYGAQLHAELGDRLGHRRTVNIGQVYATLERLGVQGLVRAAGVTDDGLPLYRITDDGRGRSSSALSRQRRTAHRTGPRCSTPCCWRRPCPEPTRASCCCPTATLVGGIRTAVADGTSAGRPRAGSRRERMRPSPPPPSRWLDGVEAELDGLVGGHDADSRAATAPTRPRRGRPSA